MTAKIPGRLAARSPPGAVETLARRQEAKAGQHKLAEARAARLDPRMAATRAAATRAKEALTRLVRQGPEVPSRLEKRGLEGPSKRALDRLARLAPGRLVRQAAEMLDPEVPDKVARPDPVEPRGARRAQAARGTLVLEGPL